VKIKLKIATFIALAFKSYGFSTVLKTGIDKLEHKARTGALHNNSKSYRA